MPFVFVPELQNPWPAKPTLPWSLTVLKPDHSCLDVASIGLVLDFYRALQVLGSVCKLLTLFGPFFKVVMVLMLHAES